MATRQKSENEVVCDDFLISNLGMLSPGWNEFRVGKERKEKRLKTRTNWRSRVAPNSSYVSRKFICLCFVSPAPLIYRRLGPHLSSSRKFSRRFTIEFSLSICHRLNVGLPILYHPAVEKNLSRKYKYRPRWIIILPLWRELGVSKWCVVGRERGKTTLA